MCHSHRFRKLCLLLRLGPVLLPPSTCPKLLYGFKPPLIVHISGLFISEQRKVVISNPAFCKKYMWDSLVTHRMYLLQFHTYKLQLMMLIQHLDTYAWSATPIKLSARPSSAIFPGKTHKQENLCPVSLSPSRRASHAHTHPVHAVLTPHQSFCFCTATRHRWSFFVFASS